MELARPVATLELSSEAERVVWRHARSASPEEACGLLLGRLASGRVRVLTVRPARNVAADRRRGYVVDPADLAAGLFAARRRGLELVGFYHSHPEGVALPSARDEAEAWPGVSYLLVSVPAVGSPVLRSYRRCRGATMREETMREERVATVDERPGRE